jgi:hypothetical protein
MPLTVAQPFKSARSEDSHPLAMPAPIIPLMRTLLCLSLAFAAGCGGESEPGPEGAVAGGTKEAPTGQPSTPAPAEKAPANQPATAGAEAPLGHPATPAEAARFLDLSTFPLMPGVPESTTRSLARLGYSVKSDVKTCFEFQKKNLEAQKWSQVPGGAVTDDYASATFTRAGFHVSVMMTRTEPGKVDVILQNGGNVDLAKLPLPPGTKPLYVGPLNATFETEAPVAAMAEECRKLLTAAGWLACGGSGEAAYYKQNGVLLRANVSAPPGQKTMITYSVEQLSADIAVMPDAEGLRYSDSRLDFDTPSSDEAVFEFYRKTLAGSGWAATMDRILEDDHKGIVYFRNPAKEMLRLEMQKIPDKNQTRVALLHQSAAAFAEEDRLEKIQIDKARQQHAGKQKLAAEGKLPAAPAQNPPMPKIVLTLPASASGVKQTPNTITFTVPKGKAKETVEAMQKPFLDTGWKQSPAVLENLAGALSLSKDAQTLNINYSDTGFTPAEIQIHAVGAELERAVAQ